MKEITELTITRSKWLRGEGSDESYLLRQEDRKMCCLGMFCLAAGVPENNIGDIRTPNAVGNDDSDCPTQLRDAHGRNHPVNKLMDANDSKTTPEDEREKAIADLMLKLNPPVKVTFVD